jgi:ubiquinone/menaquinone biosynthesis C-methylase UbiE
MASNSVKTKTSAPWDNAEAYQVLIGRWSREVAYEFIKWLAPVPGINWLDIGCGTGALSQVILQNAEPFAVKGLDLSKEFVRYARRIIEDERASFDIGDAMALPVETSAYDAAVSGLVLNFMPLRERAQAEMKRAVRPGGIIAAYVWDYGGKAQPLRHFWNAAVAVDPSAYDLDEGRRFKVCNPETLTALFSQAGLEEIMVRALDVWIEFKNFEDYWQPFLGGIGPAAAYCRSLPKEKRAALRKRLQNSLPATVDGSIPLISRAWAICGIR